VFVGDRLREDIRGAAAVGMRTVHIVRDGSPPPALPSDSAAEAVIQSLSELPALLLATSRL
jgi:putative hydrolase of the HAD superfamily